MTELEIIKGMISIALDRLYSKDSYLILNNEEEYDAHVSERGIVFRFGVYFDEMARIEFPILNVDSEYNRNISDIKRMNTRPNGILPDLILHRRGIHENNKIVIEFKPWWNPDHGDDKKKIEYLCDQEGKYKYKYGAMILLGKTRECAKVQIFSENTWND